MLLPKNFIVDTELILEDGAAAITADGAGSDIIDLKSGASIGSQGLGPEMFGAVVLDISALDEVTGDELYTIVAEFSDSSTFASGIVSGVMMQFGDEDTMQGATETDKVAGRYWMPVTNEIMGTVYRYMRLYVDVGASTTPSITFTAYLALRQH